MVRILKQVDNDTYISDDYKYKMFRSVEGYWILVDVNKNFVDKDHFRFEIANRNNFEIVPLTSI